MESEKIQVEGNWYYVNAESLADTSIIKLFLYKDPELTKIAKNAAGLTRMVDKNDLEDVLKESLNEERQYSQDQLKTDFLAYAKDNKIRRGKAKKLWQKIYMSWYKNRIHSDSDLAIVMKELRESIGGSVGGAGYAVWGGSTGAYTGGGIGGAGRGRGFGGSNNLGGGPNLMYTYSVVPLNQLLQPKGTPQGDERYIHVGSEVQGKVLGKEEEIHGKIISIKDDGEGNILHYVVQDFETAEKHEVDPTSVSLITHEERPEASMMDYVGTVGESFYPSLRDYMGEGKRDARDSLKRSKLPKDLKEKILKLGLSGFKDGRAHGIGKPKVKGKSFNGVSLGADKNGFFVYTHRARCKSKSDPEKISDKDIKFIKSTG